jgi:hypothetical protein
MRKILSFLLVVVLAAPAFSSVPNQGFKSEKAIGFQEISTATLAASTALTVPAGTKHVWISVVGGAVRMRDDGTAPTATVGVYLGQNTILIIANDPKMLADMRFICASGQSCALSVRYSRDRKPTE